MSRLFRIVLTWVLVCAVPAQGLAAATMIHCGPGHHGGSTAQAHAAHSHQHEHGAATAPHGHDNAAPHHSHVDAPAAGTPDVGDAADPPAAQKIAKTSCSACASCCTAAALPTAVLTFDVTPVHASVVALVPRSIAAFVTDGPDRPPRSMILA